MKKLLIALMLMPLMASSQTTTLELNVGSGFGRKINRNFAEVNLLYGKKVKAGTGLGLEIGHSVSVKSTIQFKYALKHVFFTSEFGQNIPITGKGGYVFGAGVGTELPILDDLIICPRISTSIRRYGNVFEPMFLSFSVSTYF